MLNMWYSFDYGAVHFVSIDSETDFAGAPENEKGDSKIFAAGKFAPEGTYLAWLEEDLRRAASDDNVAWIVAGGHRPFTSYSPENAATLADLFAKYGVVVYFAGHAHSYTRTENYTTSTAAARATPSSNNMPAATTHITVGGAGCEEMLFAPDNPTPGLHVNTTCYDWTQRVFPGGLKKNNIATCQSASFFTDAYAIGVLTVADGGRGDMQWQLLSSIDGSVLDEVTWPANR